MKKDKSGAKETESNKCPVCGSDLQPIEELPSGKRLQRCSKGSWNSETKQVEGCKFVRWFNPDPEKLDEKCPKCGNPLIMITTRSGKKLKKCSTAGWDREKREATGCDYVEWLQGSKEELDEKCPKCGNILQLVTTSNGKKLKKCSTAGWDRETRKATGCDYVEWLNEKKPSNGDENFPDHEI